MYVYFDPSLISYLTSLGMLLLGIPDHDGENWREELFLLLRRRQHGVLWRRFENQCLEPQLLELCPSEHDHCTWVCGNFDRGWRRPAVVNTPNHSGRRHGRLSRMRLRLNG